MTRVLYLEDEKWQAINAVAVLETELGHVVSLVSSLSSAESELQNRAFDVIVADIMMSDNGPIAYEDSAFVVVEKLRAGAYSLAGNGPDLPVIFATGVKDMEMTWRDGQRLQVSQAVAKMGADEGECLMKPYTVDALAHAIDQVTANRGG